MAEEENTEPVKRKRWIPHFMLGYTVSSADDEEVVETPALAAQFAINVYRQIHVLEKSSVVKFNKELLAMPAKVRAELSNFPGGAEVGEYLHFLETGGETARAHAAVEEDGAEYDDEIQNRSRAIDSALTSLAGMGLGVGIAAGGGMDMDELNRALETFAAKQKETLHSEIVAEIGKIAMDPNNLAGEIGRGFEEALKRVEAEQKQAIESLARDLAAVREKAAAPAVPAELIEKLERKISRDSEELQTLSKALEESEARSRTERREAMRLLQEEVERRTRDMIARNPLRHAAVESAPSVPVMKPAADATTEPEPISVPAAPVAAPVAATVDDLEAFKDAYTGDSMRPELLHSGSPFRAVLADAPEAAPKTA